MQNQQLDDRLSFADTVFLHLEREGMPLNVASIYVLEGKISFGATLRFVESKLPLIPRYLKRVVSPLFGIGLPRWEYDLTFDIRNHVREVTPRRGSDNELKVVAGRILSQVMDRQHPLWDLTLVHGLEGNRTGLIARMHHCMTDGISGLGLMNVLFDTSPVAPRLPRKKLRLPDPPRRDPLTLLMGGFLDSCSDAVERILTAVKDVSSAAEQVTANGGNLPADEYSRFLPEITAATERLRFNVPCRGPQKFSFADFPLAEVKAIRHNCGTSVNDIVLALVTATIRRYCELHGDRVKGRLLRIMVPVSLRGSESPGELGNRISLIPVTIPLDIRNPRKLLAAVHERMDFLKRVHAAQLMSLAGDLIGFFPTSLLALGGPIASQLPITPFNLVCTNLPGPETPLYLLGHEIVRWYPYVPIGGEMAVNCAVLSYNGTVYFGFSGDVHASPDLGRFETFLEQSFTELREAACGTPARKRKNTKRAKAKGIPTPAPAATADAPVLRPTTLPAVESKAAAA